LNWQGLDQWQQWALGIGGSLGAACIVWLCTRLFGNRKRIGSSATVQSPILTQNFQPVINVHTSVVGSVEPVKQKLKDRDEGSRTKPLPHFQYRGHREKPVFINPYARFGIHDPRDSKEIEGATEALVLRFENEPRGTMTARAMDVVAKISFRSSRGNREEIDYGIWLNSPCDCTDMEVGDTRELMLIAVMDGKLSGFDDRREENHDYDSEWSWLADREIDDLASVEVRLIDRRTAATRKFSFQIKYDGKHFDVRDTDASTPVGAVPSTQPGPAIGPAARELLIEASKDQQGLVMSSQTWEGSSVQTNGRNLVERGSSRSEAKWRGAVAELSNAGLLEDRAGEGELFFVTDEGYRIAKLLQQQ